jgi:hypothetical protein
MNNEKPVKAHFYESMINHPFLWGILLFMIISMLSSLLSGLFIFRGEEPSAIKFLFFGLWNFTTLIGFFIASYTINIERNFTNKKDMLLQEINLSKGKRVAILIPTLIIAIMLALIPITLLLELDRVYFPLVASAMVLFMFLPFILFIPLILWGVFKHKQALKFNILFSALFIVLLILSAIIISLI